MKKNSLNHLAIIMDGNGRWATKKLLPKVEGHRQGAETAKKIIKACPSFNIKYITLYTFSSENWLRPEEEVSNIIHLLTFYLEKELKSLHENNIRIKVIGNIEKLSTSLQEKIQNATLLTKDNNDLTVCIAFGYGGRDEIINAAKKIVRNNINPEEITESLFQSYLFDPEMPNVDMMIRTSGEHRISNFLLWHSSYAELYFPEKYWPDFDESDLKIAVEEFQSRKRNFGYSREQNLTSKLTN